MKKSNNIIKYSKHKYDVDIVSTYLSLVEDLDKISENINFTNFAKEEYKERFKMIAIDFLKGKGVDFDLLLEHRGSFVIDAKTDLDQFNIWLVMQLMITKSEIIPLKLEWLSLDWKNKPEFADQIEFRVLPRILDNKYKDIKEQTQAISNWLLNLRKEIEYPTSKLKTRKGRNPANSEKKDIHGARTIIIEKSIQDFILKALTPLLKDVSQKNLLSEKIQGNEIKEVIDLECSAISFADIFFRLKRNAKIISPNTTIVLWILNDFSFLDNKEGRNMYFKTTKGYLKNIISGQKSVAKEKRIDLTGIIE